MGGRSAVVVFLLMELMLCCPTKAQDHLEPESNLLSAPNAGLDTAIRIHQTLLKDAEMYHLGRMVCLPAFEPEWVVTITRDQPEARDTPHSYFVEYVGAEKQLFPPEGVPRGDGKVKRSRAPLDPETAESLNKTWRRMLRMTRYPKKPKEPEIGDDGKHYHYSRFVPWFDRGVYDPLAGWEQGQVVAPKENSLTGELVAVGEELKKYALAKPDNREKVRSEIRMKLKSLTAKLDRLGQNE